MGSSDSRSEERRSGEEPGSKARAIVLLRLTLIIATSYLLLAQGPLLSFRPLTAWLIVAALASNLPFLWLPRALIESTRFGAALIVVDTAWISAVLFSSGYQDVDFYVVYFFVLFLAAVSENLRLMTLGTVLVSVAYLYWVFSAQGGTVAWSSPTLIRLPFFFAVAALYGFLADRVRRERLANERLLQIARRDPLTELPNRRTLEERVERTISRCARTGRRMALLLLDLDDFKSVNDTHGHAQGDQLLLTIAERLRGSVRGIDALSRYQRGTLDTPSRLGGDEFAVVLTEIREISDITTVAERLCDLISQPVQLDNLEIATTASIGIAVYGGEPADPPIEAGALPEIRQQLLGQADRALYRAKQEGRNTFRFHDLEMDRAINFRVALTHDLKGILQRDELFLEFQPQVDLRRRTVVGAEALLRWQHPERGPVGPAEFIPVAESSGQIRVIGEWILGAACREARLWREIDPKGIPVAVNLSPVQFRDPELPGIVALALEKEELPPDSLELELTEGVFLKATPTVTESLRVLHDDVGVGISLDDFGRGFSSLEYLRRFPIDKLKVDKLFVGSIDEGPDSRAMVRAILALARSLRLVVVAEGVETESQLDFLVAEGCERAQGYYFSKAVRGPVFRQLLTEGGLRIQPTGAP